MKFLLYTIASLLIVIWAILFKPDELVHLLLAIAIAIILFTIVFGKSLSGKSGKNEKLKH
jgi:hypothetical protein